MFEFKPVSSDPAPSAIPHWPQSLSRTSQKTILITSWSYSGKTVCFYSLHFFFFFPKCPQCQKPRGYLGRIETTFFDGEVKTHTSENTLLAGAREPLSKAEEQPRGALQGGCSGLGRGVLSAGVQCKAWLLGRCWLDDGVFSEPAVLSVN